MLLRRITQHVRDQNWTAIAIDFVIVVVGVFFGLQVNNWNEARADAAKEQVYLRQLAADLRETEAAALRADSLERSEERAITQLLRGFARPETPSRDSLIAWLRVAFDYAEPPQPVSGTATALISTGDLALIRDDSLRSAITDYVEQARLLQRTQERYVDLFVESGNGAVERVDFVGVLSAGMSADALDSLARSSPTFFLPEGPRRVRFPFDAEGFFSSRQAYEAVIYGWASKRNLRDVRARIRDSADVLRRRVQAQID